MKKELERGKRERTERVNIDSVPEVEVLLGPAGEGVHVCQQVGLGHPLGAQGLVSLPDGGGVVDTGHHRINEVSAAQRLLDCQLALKSQKVDNYF